MESKTKLTLEVTVRGIQSGSDIDIKFMGYDKNDIEEIKKDILNTIQPLIKCPQTYLISIELFEPAMPITFNEDGMLVRKCIESMEMSATYTCKNGFWEWNTNSFLIGK